MKSIMKDKLLLENTRTLHLLYVEDDVKLLESTKEIFEIFFNSVTTATNGEDGLTSYKDFYQAHNYYYDIVITDINMPKLNGLDMAEKMLKINAEQAIIITTAHNEMQYLSKAINLGVDGFIIKPIEAHKLKKVLFKSAQAITDRKFVISHVDMIEDLNVLLDTQNKELLAKNKELEKSFRMLDTMVKKEQVAHNQEEHSHENTPNNNQTTKYLEEQIQSLINDDLDELRELHSDIDLDIIATINNPALLLSSNILEELTDNFSRYASILSFYNFFDELSQSISLFSNTLKESPIPDDAMRIENVFMLLESFMYVLKKWQEDLASEDKSKINALDASIISDMQTITNMWTQEKEEEAPLEDLDDIFDF